MTLILVLIVDDNAPLCKAVERWLSTEPGFAPVVSQGDWRLAEEDVRRHQPDVVLLDADMPGTSGLDLIAPLMRACPAAKIITFSGAASRDNVEQALSNGAAGYIVKDSEPFRIPDLLRRAVAGEVVLCPTSTEAFMGRAGDG